MSPLPIAPPMPPIISDLSKLQQLVIPKATALIVRCAHYGTGLRVVETLRLRERQAWLWGANREFEHPEATRARLLLEEGQRNHAPNLIDLQNAYNDACRTRTNAKPGESNHEGGWALDVVPMDAWGVRARWDYPLWVKIGEIGESVGLSWGGRWPTRHDNPHFELDRP